MSERTAVHRRIRRGCVAIPALIAASVETQFPRWMMSAQFELVNGRIAFGRLWSVERGQLWSVERGQLNAVGAVGAVDDRDASRAAQRAATGEAVTP